MDDLAREFADDAHHLFIYPREAHPEIARSENLPYLAFTSFEDKLQRARILKETHRSPRTMLVDGLDGEVHRQYAGVPNQCWVLDHTGRVFFKASWTRTHDVRSALEEALLWRKLKRKGDVFVQYYREAISYRFPNLEP